MSIGIPQSGNDSIAEPPLVTGPWRLIKAKSEYFQEALVTRRSVSRLQR